MNTEVDLDTKRKELLRDYLPICAGNLANAKMCVENELVRLGLISEPFEDPKVEVKEEPKTETHDDVTNVEWVNDVKPEVKAKTKHNLKNKPCKDHLDIEYPSVTEMCKQYKIGVKTYASRRHRGMSVEAALTTPIGKAKSPNPDKIKLAKQPKVVREVIRVTQADVEKACKNANTKNAASLPKEVKQDKPLEPIAEKVVEPKQELKPTFPAIMVNSSKDEIQSVKLTQEQEKEVDDLLPYGPTNPTPNDPVNHPSHYQGNGVECIDCIASAVSGLDGFHGFCAGNAIKYIFRFSHKNGVEDLRKAEWYIDRLIKSIPGRHE